MTANVMNTSRSRWGKSWGRASAAARLTAPRMPAHPTTVVSRHDRVERRAAPTSRCPPGSAVTANIHAMRTTITVPTTADASMASEPDSRLTRLSSIGRSSRPIRRNDAPVSRKTMRSQISRCCSRAAAVSDADPKRPK